MLVVGMGGTARDGSSSERALRFALHHAEALGAETRCLTASDLCLPPYSPANGHRSPVAARLVDSLCDADGVLLASPAYHGTVSGLMKNALDYAEDLSGRPRPYLDGVAVGCISVASGWQAGVGTLRTLRDIVHALRGWPTPYGAVITTSVRANGPEDWMDGSARASLELVAEQVVSFARRSLAAIEVCEGSAGPGERTPVKLRS